MTDSAKYCTGCKTTKQLTDFSKNRTQKSGLSNWCKLCMNGNSLRWGRTPKGIASKWAAHLKYTYKISPGDYEALVVAQGGICAICQRPNPKPNRPLDLDHDHETGRIRGLLCHRCNMGIGFFEHDVNIMQRAIEFITDEEE